MGKHINFFGYTLWVLDNGEQLHNQLAASRHRFYSPRVLAAYSIIISFCLGIFLYSINLSRRGYLWQGRVLAALSILLIASQFLQVFLSPSNSFTRYRSEFLFNILVAANLYGSEKPHFDRAIRNGGKPARWWVPLVWITGIVTIEFLIYFWLQILRL